MSLTEDILMKVAETVKNSKYLIALTGAGISKESNVPTFRGKDGLWKNYDAMELATPYAFRNDPNLVWEWYSWRQGLIISCDPNPAHHTLVSWERSGLLKALVTQNVDGLHVRAGSSNVLEIHGDLWTVKCTSCTYKGRLDLPAEGIPTCPECNSILRPDVVWFGEGLDTVLLSEVYAHLQQTDVCLVIGTSAIVEPAASFPIKVKLNGGIVIEFNVEETPLTPIADIHVSGKAGEKLPEIDEMLSE